MTHGIMHWREAFSPSRSFEKKPGCGKIEPNKNKNKNKMPTKDEKLLRELESCPSNLDFSLISLLPFKSSIDFSNLESIEPVNFADVWKNVLLNIDKQISK